MAFLDLKEIFQVLVVTTHVEWAKLTGTKVGWHSCVVNLFRDFRVTTGAKLITFLYKKKPSTPMTRVLNYDVFLKKEINEQALIWLCKNIVCENTGMQWSMIKESMYELW